MEIVLHTTANASDSRINYKEGIRSKDRQPEAKVVIADCESRVVIL